MDRTLEEKNPQKVIDKSFWLANYNKIFQKICVEMKWDYNLTNNL